jgi:hypothetical protein
LTINSAIDKGMAKLRKYYLKTRALNNKYKVLYLSLISLLFIGLTSGLSINIKNKLKEEYKL